MSKKKFALISEIDPTNPESWTDKVFLTLDIDWAHDAVLEDSIDLIESFDIAATWFVTHDTPLLERMRKNRKFELGIHPNFNFLLNLENNLGNNPAEVIDNLMKIVPEATSVRSHHMTQSSAILNVFSKYGLTHDCNHFIPYQAGISLKPWHLWNGIVRVPYHWEDDIERIYESRNSSRDIKDCLKEEGLQVFDFHPIHIFLNTEHLDRYERTRAFHRLPEQLINDRFIGEGSRKNMIDLITTVLSGSLQ